MLTVALVILRSMCHHVVSEVDGIDFRRVEVLADVCRGFVPYALRLLEQIRFHEQDVELGYMDL
jgi:hypothetical protein